MIWAFLINKPLLLLQESVSADISFKTLQRLGSMLEDMLTAEDIERISLHGFKSFSIEVEACESMFENFFSFYLKYHSNL